MLSWCQTDSIVPRLYFDGKIAQRHVDCLGFIDTRSLCQVLRCFARDSGGVVGGAVTEGYLIAKGDRKSTRLNSGPLMRISYAVFCLKKKKKNNREYTNKRISRRSE